MSNKYSSKIRWVERNDDIPEDGGPVIGFRLILAESHTAFGRLVVENNSGEYVLWCDDECDDGWVVCSYEMREIFRLADIFIEESARRLAEAIYGGEHGSPISVVDYVRENHHLNRRPVEGSVTQ